MSGSMEKKPALDKEQALRRLTALCAKSEHCCHDLRQKMWQWGLSNGQQQEVIDYLESHDFVNDRRYAMALAKDKMRYDKWGPRKIEQALMAKGIGAELRKEALGQFDDEEFADILRPLIENKRKSLATSDPRQRQQKLMQYALGRGFTYGLIKSCMETLDDSFDEDDV